MRKKAMLLNVMLVGVFITISLHSLYGFLAVSCAGFVKRFKNAADSEELRFRAERYFRASL